MTMMSEHQLCVEEDSAASGSAAPSASLGQFRWYIAHVLTGHENKVKKALLERIANLRSQDYFEEIVVPEETVVTNVKGKKRAIKKKFFPGYVLIKMIMNDRTWHLVKDTDKVTGFIGSDKNKPTPISNDEADFMLGQIKDGFKKTRLNVAFTDGDLVKVIEGPFASFTGVVEAVTDKGKVKVQVSIFGRPTPVELDFTQVEKVS